MRTLTPAARRALRAKAHPLHPVVSIGHHGLTPAVVHEIDVNLLAHELIKVRVFGDDKSEREALLGRICDQLDAAPVQHLGKVLTIWRPAPPPEPVAPRPARRERAGATKAGATKSGATKSGATATGKNSAAARAAVVPRAKRAPRRGPSVIVGGEAATRTPRGGTAKSGAKPASRRPPSPHGKSLSSSVGASGARRRRKAR